MKTYKLLVSMLLAFVLVAQPLGGVNAQAFASPESSSNGERFLSEGENAARSEVITGFLLDENTLSQEASVGSNYSVSLPAKISATYNIVENDGIVVEEGLIKDVEVTWSESSGSTFATTQTATYSYKAQAIDTTLFFADGVTLPVITAVVSEPKMEESDFGLNPASEEIKTGITFWITNPTVGETTRDFTVNARTSDPNVVINSIEMIPINEEDPSIAKPATIVGATGVFAVTPNKEYKILVHYTDSGSGSSVDVTDTFFSYALNSEQF